MERRLAEIPTEEWGDVQVDITPREYVLDYLAHSFPTQLYEPFTDSEGNLSSRPVYRDGQPVQMPGSRRAPRPPDREARLAAAGAGRARPDRAALRHRHGRRSDRPLAPDRAQAGDRVDRLSSRTAPARPTSPRPQAFMDDEKRILVFSDAGGTGRSYHAELSARNRRLRVHYLLEAGWKADTAIQGLGRTNRTNQAQPPLFRPIATDVKAEKRFLSTIARRLDTLGAITGPAPDRRAGPVPPRGQSRKPLCAAMRCASSTCCWSRGKVEAARLQTFEDATGLKLIGRQRHQGRAAADHDLPQSPAGADHRSAEHPVHRVRAVADRADRGRDRVRHL